MICYAADQILKQCHPAVAPGTHAGVLQVWGRVCLTGHADSVMKKVRLAPLREASIGPRSFHFLYVFDKVKIEQTKMSM